MTAWQEVMLKDVVSVLGDGLHGTPEYDDNGEYYFINGNNLSYGKIVIKESTMRASKEEFERYKKNLNDRTILVSINGTIGNVALYNNEKCILGKSACYFNALEEVDKKFIFYVTTGHHFQNYISEFANGTTIKNVPLKAIREYSFLIPELPEQKAIAAVLSSLDDKIDLLHRQSQTLEAMAATLFRQWFVEEVQEDWEVGVISDLISVLSGFPFKSTSFIDSGKYRLITIKAVQDGYLELSGADMLDEIPPRMPDYCHLQNGDILLSLTGNVGRCCFVDNDDLLLNQRVAKLQPKQVRDWAFTYVLFRQSSMKRMLEELAKGTAQANLSPIETSRMEFVIPSKAMLEKYNACATPILKKVLSNIAQIKSLEKLRDNLLPKLMSGKVRVTA